MKNCDDCVDFSAVQKPVDTLAVLFVLSAFFMALIMIVWSFFSAFGWLPRFVPDVSSGITRIPKSAVVLLVVLVGAMMASIALPLVKMIYKNNVLARKFCDFLDDSGQYHCHPLEKQHAVSRWPVASETRIPGFGLIHGPVIIRSVGGWFGRENRVVTTYPHCGDYKIRSWRGDDLRLAYFNWDSNRWDVVSAAPPVLLRTVKFYESLESALEGAVVYRQMTDELAQETLRIIGECLVSQERISSPQIQKFREDLQKLLWILVRYRPGGGKMTDMEWGALTEQWIQAGIPDQKVRQLVQAAMAAMFHRYTGRALVL